MSEVAARKLQGGNSCCPRTGLRDEYNLIGKLSTDQRERGLGKGVDLKRARNWAKVKQALNAP